MMDNSTQQTPYDRIKTKLQPGDVIAFGGNDIKSRGIRLATRSAVSHVAAVVRTYYDRTDGPTGVSHEIVEATWLLNEKPGVNRHWLDERLDSYNGSMWWLPLRDTIRRQFDVAKFQAFMLSKVGVPFDFVQSLQAAPDRSDVTPGLCRMTYAPEDLTRLFCSELVAAGLREGGALHHVNCSEITPADVSSFSLYASEYVQLKGKATKIERYNSVNPDYWGVMPSRNEDGCSISGSGSA